MFIPELGLALDDVRWRLLNADVAKACIQKKSDNDIIDKARNALSIAPYALDVKANLGRLLLLESLKQEDKEKRDEYIKKAQKTYTELVDTGWDPGYVHYRLAQIYWIQGDFQNASNHANKAREPSIRDVFGPLDQLLKFIDEKRLFTKDDI